MSSKWHYDRREGALVVLVNEQGDHHPVPVSILPAEAKEGDWLVATSTGYRVDKAEIDTRRQRVLALQQRLRRR